MENKILTYTIAAIAGLSYLFLLAKLDETDRALARAEAEKKVHLCGLPEGREVLHITPSLDGKGWDCSISKWKDGQYFVQRREIK